MVVMKKKKKSTLDSSSKTLLIVISIFVLMLVTVVAYSVFKPVKATYSVTTGYCYLCNDTYVWSTYTKDCEVVARDVTEDECGSSGNDCPSGYIHNEVGVCIPETSVGNCYLCNHKYIWSTYTKDCPVHLRDVTSSQCPVGTCESGYKLNNDGECVPKNTLGNCYLCNHKYTWSIYTKDCPVYSRNVTSNQCPSGCESGYIADGQGGCTEDVTGYYVSFYSNGGKFSNNSTLVKQPYTYNSGDHKYHASYPSTDPTYTGYQFLGWTFGSASECSDTSNIYGGVYHPTIHGAQWNDINNTRKYYACWSANNYTVTFDSNGGSSVATQTVSYGNKATKPTDPTKSGYKFTGWLLKPGMSVYDFNTPVTSNIELLASYSKVTTGYKVTFDKNGGNFAGTAASTIEKMCTNIDSTGSCRLSVTDISVSWPSNRYRFTGWATSSSCKAGSTSSVVVKADTKYYACWVENPSSSSSAPKYTVTLNVNGGTWAYSGNSKTFEYVDSLDFPVVTKSGCSLIGWCVSATTCSSPLHEYVDYEENGKTVYASWSCVSPSTSNSSSSKPSSSKPASSSSKPSSSPKPRSSPKPSSNVDENPSTGLYGTFIAWAIGLMAFGVSFYFFKKNNGIGN